PSPRAWGLGGQVLGPLGDRRSIPTCVGLGRGAPGSSPPPAVHPHVRGAWALAEDLPAKDDGPSPRAWGLAVFFEQTVQNWRSIPPCVGLGDRCARSSPCSSVHPHVRGAWNLAARQRKKRGGPSPRAWGLDFPTCTNFRRYRFAAKHIEATRTPVATPSLSVVSLMVRAT